MKYCYIDFEYKGTSEEKLDLVSCSYKLSDRPELSHDYWLHGDPEAKSNLSEALTWLGKNGYIFVAYAVTAEASAFYSLGLNPKLFTWIDLYLEYRCLTNHNHNWMYGDQLIDGKVKKTKPPINKYNMTEEQKKRFNNSKPQHSLSSACYKILGTKIDTDFKDAVRDIIIYGSDQEILEAKGEIMLYNKSDIDYLPQIFKGIVDEYKRLLRRHPQQLKTLRQEMYLRGDYSARTAIMERRGYPIDFERSYNFSRSVNEILRSIQAEINELFPKIHPFTKKRSRDYSWSHVRTREWIETLPVGIKSNWMRTNSGQYSLSADAFKEHFNFRHDFPKDNFGAQMVRYLALKRNLNGFIQSKTAKKKDNFFNYVGTDHRVRPYFGIYGSQSARSQPKATGFLFLKSAWMRALCTPEEGYGLAGIDYKSQEFLLAALLSEDENMIQAYESGDPYFYLAKLAKAVPWNGNREDYEEERAIFKVVTLALQYGMGPQALANELTQKLGKPFSVAKAKQLINLFNSSYRKHYRWKTKMLMQYRKDGYLKLPCGWYLWGDNENERSSGNFPVQGFGSSIMRKAVALAQDRGIDVVFTLHDAIYIQYALGNERDITVLANCMREAFSHYFVGDVSKYAKVGLDANCWSPEYTDGYFNMEGLGKVKKQSLYIDERSIKEYQQFSKYFDYEECYL